MSTYSDINYSLERTQYSDFPFKTDLASIKQSIETIILTKKGERTKYQNPYFGSNIYYLLFEKMTIITQVQIEDEIRTVLGIWEPRIEVTEVIVNPDYGNNTYNIEVYYKIIDLNITDELILQLNIIQ